MHTLNYIAIAEILRAEHSINQGNDLAQLAVRNITFSLADYFKRENARFDRATFYDAIGIGNA